MGLFEGAGQNFMYLKLAILTFVFISNAYAEDELKDSPRAREVAADILLFHTPVKDRFKSYLLANTTNLGEAERGEFIAVMLDRASWGELRKLYVEALTKNYTLKQLIKLIELAESPEGKEIIFKQPFFTRQVVLGLESEVDRVLNERRTLPEAPPKPPLKPLPPPDERI